MCDIICITFYFLWNFLHCTNTQWLSRKDSFYGLSQSSLTRCLFAGSSEDQNYDNKHHRCCCLSVCLSVCQVTRGQKVLMTGRVFGSRCVFDRALVIWGHGLPVNLWIYLPVSLKKATRATVWKTPRHRGNVYKRRTRKMKKEFCWRPQRLKKNSFSIEGQSCRRPPLNKLQRNLSSLLLFTTDRNRLLLKLSENSKHCRKITLLEI